MLEPVDEVAVLVPDDLVGTVMSDLSGRRGHVLGSEPVGDDRTLVRAEVPQIEIGRYAIDLRAFSHGAASFTRTFARYEPMPDNLAAKLRSSSSRADGGSGPGVGRVQRERATGRPGAPRSAPPARRTPALAHQLDQLARRWRRRPGPARRAPRCCRSSTSRGRGRRAPSRGGRTPRSRPRCTSCRPGSSTSRNVRRIGSCQQTSGLVSTKCRPSRSASPCRAQPSPPGKPGRLRKMQAPSTTAVLRSPSSSVSTQSLPLALVVELPVLGVELA